jgi:hypothetical protein
MLPPWALVALALVIAVALAAYFIALLMWPIAPQ